MSKLKKTLIFGIILFIAFACSTGQRAFNQGDYYDATLQAVKRLRSKPDSEKALKLVQKSYPMAIDYKKQRIDQLASSNHPDKFLNIVEEYEELNRMADEITRCPAALEVLRPVVYFNDQLEKARIMATEEQYQNALALLKSTNIEDARLAMRRLEWVKEMDHNYKRVDHFIAVAKDLATMKIVVENEGVRKSKYRINTHVFYSRLYDHLIKNSGSEFVHFYQPEVAEELEVEPHQVVKVLFHNFDIGTMHEREQTASYESDSIVVGTYTDANGDEYDVMGVVRAKATIYSREVIARGVLSVSIIDYESMQVIESRKYPGEYLWKNEWATFNGDSRALPDRIHALTEEKQYMPPSPQEMYLLLSDPMFESASAYLNSYYRKW